jgi:hypothetical protein
MGATSSLYPGPMSGTCCLPRPSAPARRADMVGLAQGASSRASHAFASRSSLSTVAGEIPRAAAVS